MLALPTPNPALPIVSAACPGRPAIRRRWLGSIVSFALLLSGLIALAPSRSALAAAPSHTTFETVGVRPLALSADGQTLFAVNTPDGRLEILDVTAAGLRLRASVAVGLEPVAVAIQDEETVWVINHLSDSVSIVRLDGEPRVTQTLQLGDEPWDIVFAGPSKSRAFIATAHRGQNSPWLKGEATTPGVGRADVWVFDVAGAATSGEPETIVTLFGDKPRALAVSPDGATVYAAVFHSGNQTTSLHEDVVCDGGESAAPCDVFGVTMPGGLPAPNENHEQVVNPEVGLIVGYDRETGRWLDELDRDWSVGVRFELPDLDVFEIDALADPPTEKAAHPHVGTILFNMAVNPANGALYVANTEANNRVRFEGEGQWASAAKPAGEPASVRGHLAESRISVVQGGEVTSRHLNKHIDYDAHPVPEGTKERSLATPLGMAVSEDGETLFLAAFGSSKIGVFQTEALENDSFVPDADDHIELSGGGPAGLVIDAARNRLYVSTRFDNGVAIVDIASRSEIGTVTLHNPELTEVIEGRPFLYDARLTSSNGETACASCHIFGDMDDLAWDLGDPDGSQVENRNPGQFLINVVPVHPMKGPMTTQSFRGMANAGPMHWRGDRSGANTEPAGDALDEDSAFKAFNGAFGGLMGREEGGLDDAQLQKFTDFSLALEYPPNPMARLDMTRTPDEAGGFEVINTNRCDGQGGPFGPCVNTCTSCHEVDRLQGFFGASGRSTLSDQSQVLKVPHWRNLYQKVGMFGNAATPMLGPDSGEMGPQIRGFGFMHDGSSGGLLRFLQFFEDVTEPQREILEQFLLAAPTTLAPIVGQQVTLDADATPDHQARVALMLDQAATLLPRADDPSARACELVARLSTPSGTSGYAWSTDDTFLTDDGSDPIPTDALLLESQAPDASLTLTCAPPGSGLRMGIDRDLDGAFDGVDNCPTLANAEQADADGDGVGDACDVCASAADPEQADTDLDGIGDACDIACDNGLDDDGDGFVDAANDPACVDASGDTELPRNDVRIQVYSRLASPSGSWFRLPIQKIPVMIFGDDRVDVQGIDVDSVRLGPGGAEPVPLLPWSDLATYGDQDQDGHEDLLLNFGRRAADLSRDEPACLTGEIDGVPFSSCEPPTPRGCGYGGELAFVVPIGVVMGGRWRRRRLGLS